MTEKIGVQYRYWLLFAVESTGALIVVWQVVPIYRRLVRGQVFESGPPIEMVVWALAGAALIHAGYWVNGPLEIRIRSVNRRMLGHVALFLGRLNFIYVSGLFGLIFFVRYEEVNFSAFNLAFFLFVLFSVFCYTRELERLGRGSGA